MAIHLVSFARDQLAHFGFDMHTISNRRVQSMMKSDQVKGEAFIRGGAMLLSNGNRGATARLLTTQ